MQWAHERSHVWKRGGKGKEPHLAIRILCFLLVLGTLWMGATCLAAGKSKQEERFEALLARQGYEPVHMAANADFSFDPKIHFSIRAPLNNGRNPLFMVDSGWTFTTLDIDDAEGLKTLGEMGAVLEDSLLGQLSGSSIRIAEKLRVGHIECVNQPIWVEKLGMQGKKEWYDGVLGWDFLARNHCLFDCWNHTLYVRTSKPMAEQAEELFALLTEDGFQSLKMKPQKSLSAEVTINGSKLNLVVDTGANTTVIHEPVAHRLHFVKAKKPPIHWGAWTSYPSQTNLVTGVGAIGSHAAWNTRPETFTIGSRTLKKQFLKVADLTAWNIRGEVGSPSAIHGLLGNDILVPNKFLIDFSSRLLWMPTGKGKKMATQKSVSK